ncbi:hypothetical protein, variant 2 [Puccinia triticina 1-1 BBBD Race 1]|uniref:Uncharacterized protein n=1 Tax=Puccinia triticina (isolate 1-1 / race 1 (BBBD)) TaxID=630390 RepID=A0A0C4ELS1_PUCT1|nr:hypothetical protein PTTG_01708 [Puccinia triticina 1-1 BBBD Race 1]OAV97478.1 hypothetical protein, variant 1 [Puccinia triticina 1-1 BBBD Race 1]OAV97479.1 hypothetical protein, variant 2 [Puccinia triticina 1-1 BBBD Race 1]WAR60615.1 hypothetical protein PtB15_9B554 [Puccinia triticina]
MNASRPRRASASTTPLRADGSTTTAPKPTEHQAIAQSSTPGKSTASGQDYILDDPLVNYRKALRLEPNVGRAYHDLEAGEIDSLERRWITSTASEDHPDPFFSFSRSFHARQDTHTRPIHQPAPTALSEDSRAGAIN